MYAFEGNNCLSMLLFRCCRSWTFPPSNFTIFHCPLSFCILHSFSLCLYHCCIVRQYLGTPYQCLIGPSYNYCYWALDDQRIPLFFNKGSIPIVIFLQYNDPSIVTYELLCNSSRWGIVGTLRNSFDMSDFLRLIMNREKKNDK